MPGLTPEEQAFFDSGGDTRHLGIADPGIQGVDPLAPSNTPVAPAPAPVDLAGLGNNDPAPAPVAPPVAAPVAAPAPIQQPVPDQSEFLRNQLAAAQQQAANLQAALEAATKAKQVAEPPAPDPDTDPLGSMLHQLDKVNKNVADLQAEINNQQNQQSQLAAFNRFQQQVQTLRDQFQTATPDFAAAYQHLRDGRMADLRLLGYQEVDISKQIFQEEVAISQAALQQGKNPAETIYEMAKRHGYTPKAATPAAPALPIPATPKLPTIKAGVESSPPSLPRTPVNEEITVESLREASDSDLNRLVSDPAAWAKIAGKDHIPL